MLTRLLWTYLKPYWQVLLAILLLQTAQAMANLYLPTINADLLDSGVLQGDTDFIMREGGLMLTITLGQVVCSILAVYLGARLAMRVGRVLRQELFDHVQTFSAREVAHFGAPSLITRETNDVQQVQMLILMTLTMVLMAPVTMIGGVVMALRQDAGLSLLLLVAIPLLALVMGLLLRKMSPLFGKVQKRIDAINRIMREQITGVRVIRAFVKDSGERRRFGGANQDLATLQKRIGYWFALAFPLVFIVMDLSQIAVVWFGGHRIDSGDLQVGAMTAFLMYLMQIMFAVLMAAFMFMMIPRAVVCAKRIKEVLDTDTSVHIDPDAATELPNPGLVELENVSFRYPGAESPVLHGISFTAEPGKTTAIIGSTGSGKTTLVNIIPRLFDVTGGQVMVGGLDVRRIDPMTLWGDIGLVPQKPYLFSGTVERNLRYGKDDATEEEIWKALEVAQATDFVKEMGGLDAAVAQGGTNVSGGQRQRLAIARALIRRPNVYLFDDSFSALDFETDSRLRAALAPQTENATVIIVAQRVGTIRDADQILVLDDGGLVGVGTHQELLESCPTYQEIVYSQMSVEEAA